MNEVLKAKIMRLQTYKMYEGEHTVYVERDDVLNAITETEGKDPATETTGLWAYFFCPVCHQALVYKQNYCSNCGQMITWTN